MTHYELASSPVRPVASALRLYGRFGKRVVDIVLVLAFMPLVLPCIALIWPLVRCYGGSGFFGHVRIGRDGRQFRCWKLRTMVPDADRILQDHLANDPTAAKEWAETFKLQHDPRITRLGAFLRRTSLDELPQFWNVLNGQMSLVGPRPITDAELDFYGPDRAIYMALRPGLTGMWQVHGRGDGCYRTRVQLDRRYATDLSLLTDLVLMLRTVVCVLGGTGR